MQPDAKGSSVQDREVLCGRNGPSRQARINQGEVAHTDDDCAEKAGNPMEVSETARADGISMCESPAHACEGGCGDPVRSVHLMDRCL